LSAGAAELGIGAVPGAFEGGNLALDAVQIGLDGFEAALHPIGAEHGIDVEGFGGGLGAVLVEVLGGEGVVIGGVFAGDDDGGGVDAVLQSVEAGGGPALDGAGSGGLLRVGAIWR
jgi:hypothetical protein